MRLIDMISRYPVSRWLIWAGAGISRAEPSLLPLGKTLTEFTLVTTCGIQVARRICSVWSSANRIIGQASRFVLGPLTPMPLDEYPRLEAVLGEISEVESHTRLVGFSFLQGFSGFAQTPFNRNHWRIACLLGAGATVITTNFDLCIEDAYRALHPGDMFVRKRIGNTYRYRSRHNPAAGDLWHIHGIAEDVQRLGTTLRIIKEGLPRGFRQLLNTKLRNGCALIFVGYSASDAFDVNLFFDSKAQTEFNKSSVVFIQHGKSKPPNAATRLAGPFGTVRLKNRNTARFLAELAQQVCSRSKYYQPNSMAFDWKTAFSNRSDVSNVHAIRCYLISKVANHLGININRMLKNCYRRALQEETKVEVDDFHRTMAIVCRMQGLSRLERFHDEKVKVKDEDLLGYFYSQGNLPKAFRYALSVQSLLYSCV